MNRATIQKVMIVIVAALILQGCNFGASGIWKNDHIEKEKREQIKILNDKIINGFINNDVNSIKVLMSDKMLKECGNDLDKLINQANRELKNDYYSILDEYNIKNSIIGINNTIPSGLNGDNGYIINYQALNREMYVSVLLTGGQDDQHLITCIYGKYDNEWKLNILLLGQYSLFGKTAFDYYTLSKASYNKTYLIDAVNYISISKQLLHPVSDIHFQYQKEKEINEYGDKVMKEAYSKFQFPLKLDNIDSKPMIFRVIPKITKEGFFPAIYYRTIFRLSDTTSLTIENEKVKKEISKLFKGIDQDKKYIIYEVCNEIPKEHNQLVHYASITQFIK